MNRDQGEKGVCFFIISPTPSDIWVFSSGGLNLAILAAENSGVLVHGYEYQQIMISPFIFKKAIRAASFRIVLPYLICLPPFIYTLIMT